jgi:hypothetical protein
MDGWMDGWMDGYTKKLDKAKIIFIRVFVMKVVFTKK